MVNANFINSTSTTISTPALSKEDLDEAEANGKLEIIKQIKKVNEDGSYTIGYEADDGTFKIESRDVLGNIKGTYGYIDENGEIKRVSYSTNSGSEIVPLKSSETSELSSSSSSSSVVQRIPKINKTVSSSSSSSSTTRRPPSILYHSASATTNPIGGSTVVIQSIPKRRTTTTTPTPSTTTADPSKISEFIKAAVEAASKSPTARPNIYENASPRILLQQRALIRNNEDAGAGLKSEGQIIRPDVISRPTELPIYRRKTVSQLSMENEGGHEPKSNVLRRQLLPEKVNNFDAKQHAMNLQQSHGDDVVDVYSSSLSTGTTRPLFTTLRPKFISSTIPPTIQRPTIRYATSQNSPEFGQESSTENLRSTTTNTVSVGQIPPDTEPMQEPLVAIRHPLHGRSVLVPLSQLQQINRYENVQFSEEPVQPIYIAHTNHQRPQRFRPIQVRIDENGFVREMPQYQEITTPYPVPVRGTQTPPDEDEINLIKPPVSTKDLQKLLEQLILRQTRLEQISYLTRKYQQMFGQRQRPIFRPNLLLYQRKSSDDMNNNVQSYTGQNLEQQNLYDYQSFGPTAESYTPTRRVARLLSAQHFRKDDQDDGDNYLPADVREMLLLRMLQLAINPSLPLNIPDSFETGFATSSMRHRKIGGARNVEILGEEDDSQKLARSKR